MSKKFDYINALRGLAIFMVIAVHTLQHGAKTQSKLLDQIIDSGARGVQLFFVASAFTLFLSYNNRENEENKTLNFFLRRFFRIAPMYYLGLLFFSLVTHNATIGAVLSNIFFVHGLHPDWVLRLVPGGWSISVEMLFYCLVPLLFKKITTINKAIYLFIAAVVFNYFFQITLLSRELSDYLFLSFPNHFSVFVCGIIAYLIVIKKDTQVGGKPLFLLAVLLLIHVIIGGNNSYVGLSGIAFMGLLIALSKKRIKILVNPFFTYLGEISYSSYLVHFAVIMGLERINFVDYIEVSDKLTGVLNYSIRFLLILSCTMAIATLFYRFVELPTQRVGRRLITSLSAAKTSSKQIKLPTQ